MTAEHRVRVLVLLFATGLCPIGIEAGMRTYDRMAYGTPWSASAEVDPVLGWPGRRIDGDLGTTKRRLLVVGDSITDGLGVPPRDMYYSIVAAQLGLEVFAYGGPGYGTLQEVLVIERLIPEIRPSVVLLQVSANDFVNNALTMEQASLTNWNGMTRPYLAGDRIVLAYPGFMPDGLRRHSRLAYYAAREGARLGALLARWGYLIDGDQEVGRLGLNHQPFREAVDVTDRLLGRLRAAVGTPTLVAFAADAYPGFREQWRRLLAKHDIPYFEGVPQALADAEARGTRLRLPDGWHWDAAGHRLAGETLVTWLAGRVSR
jgi:lysophospholipase L1-like esterase